MDVLVWDATGGGFGWVGYKYTPATGYLVGDEEVGLAHIVRDGE